MNKDKDNNYPVPSVHRAFILLELIAQSEEGKGVAELARRTGWPKSSIFNILKTLALDGYLVQDSGSGRYRMTIKVFSLGGMVVDRIDIRRLAYPYLVELREKTGETVNLGILSDDEAIYLESISGPGAIRVDTWPGKRLYLHRTALGKALAAELDPEVLTAIIAKTGLPPGTANTHTSLPSLLADLELTRQRGYSLDNEEDEIGMRCIGATIHDHTGNTVAAVSLTALAHRLPLEDVPEIANAVKHTAHRISELLGYPESEDPIFEA
jgi:DNA-binding IclR family transcriptional regulator